jgi:hypothetical protein
VKGRKIWGELVPYDKTWRAGANAATKLTASRDFSSEVSRCPWAATRCTPSRARPAGWCAQYQPASRGNDGFEAKNDVVRVNVAAGDQGSRAPDLLFQRHDRRGREVDWRGEATHQRTDPGRHQDRSRQRSTKPWTRPGARTSPLRATCWRAVEICQGARLRDQSIGDQAHLVEPLGARRSSAEPHARRGATGESSAARDGRSDLSRSSRMKSARPWRVEEES